MPLYKNIIMVGNIPLYFRKIYTVYYTAYISSFCRCNKIRSRLLSTFTAHFIVS